jgi:hypothetical protein
MKLSNIRITDHALHQYLLRSEVLTESKLKELFQDYRKGVSDARATVLKYKRQLAIKFSRTILTRLCNDGIEYRKETSRVNMNDRCSFVATRKGNKFIVITTYLQGSERNFWKVGVAN